MSTAQQALDLCKSGTPGLAERVLSGWRGKQVVVVSDAYPPANPVLGELARAGAELVGIVCRSRRTGGPAPSCPVWVAEDEGHPVSVWQFATWLRTPPQSLVVWLDAVDPRGASTIVGNVHTSVGSVAGRRAYGCRPPGWLRFEDKTQVNAVFDAVGVPVPRSLVTAASSADSLHLFSLLDGGAGVVVSLDTTHGVRGACAGVRWAGTEADLGEVLRWASTSTTAVRVAQAVPGVPCSVLGVCTPGGVVAFDPIEIVTLRASDSPVLYGCGWSSLWRPPSVEAERLREHCIRVGAELARSAGFVGFFSVDGVLGTEGFVATEVNARLSSGLDLHAFGPGFPLELFHRALVERDPVTSAAEVTRLVDAVRRRTRENPAAELSDPTVGSANRFVLRRTMRATFEVAEEGTEKARRSKPLRVGDLIGPVLAELIGAGTESVAS